MPKFTPEKEQKILETYIRTLDYVNTAREMDVTEKAVKSVVEKYRETPLAANADNQNLESQSDRNRAKAGLTRAEQKQLYTTFLAGKRLGKIVAEDGFDPADVEKEHDRFLKFEGLDPHSMQKKVLTSVGMFSSRLPENEVLQNSYDRMKKKFFDNKYLTDQEFDELVNLLAKFNHHRGRNSVRNPSLPAPEYWVRPTCSKCGEAMRGVVLDPNTPLEKAPLDFLKTWSHGRCKDITFQGKHGRAG